MKPKWMKQIVEDSCEFRLNQEPELAQWCQMIDHRRHILPYSADCIRDKLATSMLREIKRLRKRLRG
jgi:hypothetical protein